MFNLIMFNVDWQAPTIRVPLSRILEYTEDHLIQEFRVNNQLQLDRLLRFPCIFCEEGRDDEVAHIGYINNARIANSEVLLEIRHDSDVPPLSNGFLLAHRAELDMHYDFEFSRNHWAVKEVDLYRFLLRTIRPRRQRPSVFQIPDHECIDRALVSAMMPFDASFGPVHQSINFAAESVGLRCRRADDIWENPSIIQDVVSLIDRSRVVVCDCTGRNPNVFYEAGIAHTLGRDVILITQNESDIPFDLRHLRFIRYLNNGEGLENLTQKLQNRMQTLMGH